MECHGVYYVLVVAGFHGVAFVVHSEFW